MNTVLIEFALPGNETSNTVVCVEFDAHQNAIKSVQLEDETVRKLNLPAAIQLSTNSKREYAFDRYNEEPSENYFFVNTPLIKETILEILKKNGDIIQPS